MEPKISVILCTAREDYSLVDLPDTRLFEPTLASLGNQTFRDFELVVVDGLLARGRQTPVLRKVSDYRNTYIRPKPSSYAKKGQWAICNSFNTGLIHAEGELVVRIDDASEFSPDYLQRIWNWHTANPDFGILSLVNYYRGGKTARWDDLNRGYYADLSKGTGQVFTEGDVKRKIELMNHVYSEGQAIEDTRLPQMPTDVMVGVSWEWVYGYIALPLEKLLAVNGMDEAFDGCKGQEDQDLGLRLTQADPKTKFVLDKGLWAIENLHSDASKDVIFYQGKPPKCNYAIIQHHKRQNTIRANERKFTEQELEEIKAESIRLPCSHEWGNEFDLKEGFRSWAEDVPTFDLRKMREEIQATSPLSGP